MAMPIASFKRGLTVKLLIMFVVIALFIKALKSLSKTVLIYNMLIQANVKGLYDVISIWCKNASI